MDYKKAIEDFNKLTSEEAKIKEVYCQFSYAVFYAQLLEQLSITLITFFKQVNSQIMTKEELDLLWDEYDFGKKTLGNLIKEIKTLYNLSEMEIIELEEILKLRNYIAHNYFRFNTGLFYSNGGKEKMIKDFVNFVAKSELIIPKLNNHFNIYAKKICVTKELSEKYLEETINIWRQKQIDVNYETLINKKDDTNSQ